MPGRPMRGFLSLPGDVVDDDGAVAAWIAKAAGYAATLPPKKPKKSKKKQATT